MFEARTTEFSGPMEKLLELIEQRSIEITRVNLSEVTGDFISYIEKLGETVSSGVLSDFIVIASRLLILKSKVLLPALELTTEEEEDILDIEQRLRLYREFSAKSKSASGGKTAAGYLAELWDQNTPLHSRPLFKSLSLSAGSPETGRAFFYPSDQVTSDQLKQSIERLLSVMSGLIPETATVRGTMVTLQEKIAELTSRLTGAVSVTLRGRVGKKEKEEVIVMFLAVLHMLSGRLAEVEQGEQFGDIVISSTDNESSTN